MREQSATNTGRLSTSGARIAVRIIAATLAVNGVLFLIHVIRKQAAPVQDARMITPPVRTSTQTVQEDAAKSIASQERDRGLRALKDGDYTLALAKLQLAHTLDPELVDAALLETTRKLQEKSVVVAEPVQPRSDEGSRRNTVRRIERNTRAATRAPAQETQRPVSGILIVKTVPEKLVVKIDGAARDLSPMRAELEVGLHRLQILRGDEVVLDRTIEIGPGKVEFVSETFNERKASAAVATPETSKAVPDCNPPFYFEGKKKVYKPACL